MAKQKQGTRSKRGHKPGKPAGPGRPTDCTPERIKSSTDLIGIGNYATVAAQAAGISDATYYNWLKRGRDGEKPFLDFLEAIKKAEADRETYRVSHIISASAEHWQAAACWLERKFPERWGRRDKVEFVDSAQALKS